MTENDSSAVFTAEASVGINVEAAVHPSLWGTVSYPSPAITGERFLPLSAAINGSLETGLLLFGEAANFNQTGVNTVNESALTVDPFLLPYQDGVPTPTASSLSLTSPFKYSDILVNTDQGIAFYETETAPGTVDQAGTIVQVALTDSDGPDNPLSVGTPAAIESNLGGVIEIALLRQPSSQAALCRATLSPGISTIAVRGPIRLTSRRSMRPERRWDRRSRSPI